MGGDALNVSTRRLSLAEFAQLKDHMLVVLAEYYNVVRVPPPNPDKTSFGDVDILVSGGKAEFDPVSHPQVLSKEKVRNGNILSFEYKGFQVDRILVQEVDMALMCYSYGDVGMILGAICKPLQLKVSQNGLFLKLSQDLFDRPDLKLSSNPAAIFDFLVLSYDRFQQGFESERDVLEFLEDAKLFRQLPNLWMCENNHFRRRSQQRPMFARFFEEHAVKLLKQDQETVELSERVDKIADQTRRQALDFFGKESEYQRLADAAAMRKRFKEVINGRSLGGWTGLSGPALGAAMVKVKACISEQEVLEM